MILLLFACTSPPPVVTPPPPPVEPARPADLEPTALRDALACAAPLPFEEATNRSEACRMLMDFSTATTWTPTEGARWFGPHVCWYPDVEWSLDYREWARLTVEPRDDTAPRGVVVAVGIRQPVSVSLLIAAGLRLPIGHNAEAHQRAVGSLEKKILALRQGQPIDDPLAELRALPPSEPMDTTPPAPTLLPVVVPTSGASMLAAGLAPHPVLYLRQSADGRLLIVSEATDSRQAPWCTAELWPIPDPNAAVAR